MKRGVRVVELMHLLPQLRRVLIPFPVCPKTCFDIVGEHISLYGASSIASTWLKDVLFEIFWQIGVPMKKKAPMNFLMVPLDRRSILRSADILMYECVWVKHACVDLNEVFPLMGLMTWNFTFGQTNLKDASNKMVKYEKTYSRHSIYFYIRYIWYF